MIPAASVAAAEQPSPVLDWNINAVNAIGNPPSNAIPGLGQPPPLAVIHLAMVQGAVYDAVNAIDGGHRPYLGGLPSTPGASMAAAVATAAHDVLLGLPPLPPNAPEAMRANVAELYRLYMLDIPAGTAKTQGIAIGRAAATAMNGNRSTDGRFVGTPLWPIGTLKGEWRPVETANANVFAWVANVRPFTMKSTGQFRTEGPYDLASPEWAAEFNEVKRLGSNDPSTRTEAQNRLASFVSFNLFSAFNRTLRDIAVANGLSTAEQAMLFVRSSISAADALIGCWDNKEHWLQWRPQTAIRLADQDGNPDTVADPTWTAQFQNPGYPDNPSGFNCFAAGVVLRREAVLRDRQDVLPGRERGNRAAAATGDPELHAVHRHHQRRHRRPHPHRLPLPKRRRAGRVARQEGRPVGRQALLRARRLTVR